MGALIRRLTTIRGARGFTLMEVIITLGVVAIMAAVLSPMILNYLEDAKKSKAEADVKAISGTILKLTRDVAHFPLYTDGTKTTGTPAIEILYGPGNNPVESTTPAWGLSATPAGKDLLENHLVKNNPAGTTSGTPATPYLTTGRFPWRGPYIESITPDPWGNRYVVNIKNADPADPSPKVVWALSAGPDGKIDTKPDALTDSGPPPGNDDIAIRIK